MTAKDIVAYLRRMFALTNINWSRQMLFAKQLLEKYKANEIKYAIDYYKEQGVNVYSLGFLLYQNNMNKPMSMYTAERHIQVQENADSGERNHNKIRQHSETKRGTEYPCYLFAETGEDTGS